MSANRLREIRKTKRLTLMKAADLIGISHTHLGRLETGERGLSIPMGKRIAKAYNYENWAHLMALDEVQATENAEEISSDAEPYTEKDLRSAGPKGTTERWRIIRPTLDLIGVTQNAIAFTDTSSDAIENLKGLEKVTATRINHNGVLVPIVRQFLPPCLLVTNSSSVNELPLNIRAGEAFITGVIRAHMIVD